MQKKKEITDKEMLNTQTEYSTETDTIIIPAKMTKLEAAHELTLQHNEEEKIVEKIKFLDNCDGKDGLVATMRVAKTTFGWINAQKKIINGMSGPIEILPREIKVQTNINEFEDCFIGEMVIAAWDDAMLKVEIGRGGVSIVVEAKKKFGKRIDDFFKAIDKEVKDNSIYKGKSLMWTMDDGFTFIENKGTDDIILNKNEQLVLDNFIIKPIKSGKKEKRGILFAGPYGTGKTETALKIGRTANEEGQTFIYCKDTNLSQVLETAKNYQPCVVFVEDIDEMASGERNEQVNDLLNTIDGIQTKGQALTLIMTTNHKEKINQAFRRPGRIDVILNFDLPKPETIAIMYERFLNNAPGLDYVRLASITPQVQGAVIKEIANRALLSVEDNEVLADKHVEMSIELTRMQIDFMKEPATVKDDSIDKKLSKMIEDEVNKGWDKHY